ncbi:MAG: biotin/lipoyl-binding protein, partial [Verrucomicrobia bacterium]|nr:biotin/lipoyl-binding protein [Verrucomicrobiota bacterium]
VVPPDNLLTVRVMSAEMEEVEITLEGHGVVRPVRSVEIAAEVAGQVTHMPRGLREGDLVGQGDVLLRIDPRDYASGVEEAEASIAQSKASLAALERRWESDRARRSLLERSKVLAEGEYERTRRLFEEQEIGSINAVEAAEQAFTRAALELSSLDQALSLYPSQQSEMEAMLRAAESRLTRAKTQLSRTEITAPFDGRVTHAAVEEGQIVQPGRHVLSLADDRELEIRFSLEASEVRNWLPFAERDREGSEVWFPPLPDLPARLSWREGRTDLTWTGRLHRIVSFDATTRTAVLAVRVNADQARHADQPIPLTEGMFCKVEIPGRTLTDVFVLPRAAVTYDGQVYLAQKENGEENGADRLRTVPVEVIRAEGDRVFVRGDISPGDRVIVTRLVAPLEGAKLEIQED